MITRRDFLKGLTATTALVAVAGGAATVDLPRITVSRFMWTDVDDLGPRDGAEETMAHTPAKYAWDKQGRRISNPDLPTVRDAVRDAWAELNA